MRPSRRVRPNREVRRITFSVVVILILSIGAAVLVARGYHLGVPAAALSLIVGGGAPAGLYMTWEGLRQAAKSGEQAATVSSDADTLADVVNKEWEEEYERRRFNDPTRQLDVSWSAADEKLTVSWDQLEQQATRGRGAQKDIQPAEWAMSPKGLIGLENELPAILRKVPTGWLAVLGGAGYGKTMLMLRLVLDLVSVNQRNPGGPVPVYMSMTSWNPAPDPRGESLRAWLERQLPIDYPGLGTMVSGDNGQHSRIATLLARQIIVPILDGLDEMEPALREQAVNRLNQAFDGSARPQQLVLTCRTDEYRDIVTPLGAPRKPLRGAAAIELHRLDPDKVAAYLAERDDPRWVPVVEKLNDPGSPLAEALQTALYASLASAIYNPNDYQLRGQVPEPAELCELPSAQSIQEHLLDKFIPALYPAEREAAEQRARDDGENPGEAQLQLPSERWLMFLARYMTYGQRDTTALEWWNLPGLAPGWLAPAVVGIISAVAVGIAAGMGTRVGVGIGVGFGTGMLIAMAIGLSARFARQRWDPRGWDRHYAKRRPGPGMAGGVIGAVIGGLAAGVAGKHGIGHEASLFSGLPEALGIGIGAGATTEFFGGLVGTLTGSFLAGYLEAVGLGLPAALVNGLGVGLAAALAVKFLGRQKPSRQVPKWDKEIGIPGGLVIGLAIGVIAWREEGLIVGAVAGLVLAVAAAFPFGLRHVDEELKLVPGPVKALDRDTTAFRLTALSAGVAAGLAGFIGGSLASVFEVSAKVDLRTVVADGLGIGVASALVIGLTFGFYHAASPEFRLINWWLAAQRKTPWRLKHFLEDAHRKTVLRQSGAKYEFRHEVLQRRLANRLEAEQEDRAGEGASSGEVPPHGTVGASPAVPIPASPADPLSDAP